MRSHPMLHIEAASFTMPAMRKRLLIFLLFPLTSILALEAPPGGTEIGGALQASANPSAGTVESMAKGKRIHITEGDDARSYRAQFTLPCNGTVKKDERVFAIIRARVVGDAAFGEIQAKLQLKGAPYTSYAPTISVAIHREWTDQPVNFPASEDIAPDAAAVVLLCGQKEQIIEVESIQVLKYPATTELSIFPKAKGIKRTYVGREPDAPWRMAALERIEKHRKADLSLDIADGGGFPLPNTEVNVRLSRHEFGFGSAITAKHMVGTNDDDKRYREIIDRLFSIVVFENDLKDGNWSPDLDASKRSQRNADLNKAFDWFSGRHIPVRGHYLMQVATPYNLHGITDPEIIRQRTLASVRERLGFVKDRVIEWDVVNHPIAWNGADMLNKRKGLEKLDREVFKEARSLTALPFFINEDQVFRPGPQCDETHAYIKSLIADGFSVAGLGNQAHFHETYLPSATHLLEVTDRFAEIVKHQTITEFDIVTTDDEELAADYTRDVLITVFSHPAYTSFLLWGFWEGSHWKPEAASWNRDWSIRQRGQVLEDWIGKKWRTDMKLKTDENGQISWRGFPGWYEVTTPTQKKAVNLPMKQPQGKIVF